VERLEALHEGAQAELQQHMMQGMQTIPAAQELLDGESPDVDGSEERLREAANHMVMAHTAMARTSVEARQLLTPEQRDRLALARSMMQEMRGGGMNGMMMDGMVQPGQQRSGHHPPTGDGSGH
jgi:Spy/CpxP family protein refolding chaperone